MGVTVCPTCRRKFWILRWRYHCYGCKGVRCRDCLTPAPSQEWLSEQRLEAKEGDGYCTGCVTSIVNPFVRRYNEALTRAYEMEHWSINYQGKPPYIFDGPTRALISDEFKIKADAIRQLKVTAAFVGFDLLIKVETHHRLETMSEPSNSGRGTHLFNEPRYHASAIAAMRFHGRSSRPSEPSTRQEPASEAAPQGAEPTSDSAATAQPRGGRPSVIIRRRQGD